MTVQKHLGRAAISARAVAGAADNLHDGRATRRIRSGVLRSNMQLSWADVGSVDRLMALTQEYYAFDGICVEHDSLRRGLMLLLADSSLGRALIVDIDGHDAGFVIFTFGFDLEFGGRQATITEFFLKSEYRGSGAGTACVEHVEAFCRSVGVRTLELQVSCGNGNARAFYEKVGFQAHSRVPMSKTMRPR